MSVKDFNSLPSGISTDSVEYMLWLGKLAQRQNIDLLKTVNFVSNVDETYLFSVSNNETRKITVSNLTYNGNQSSLVVSSVTLINGAGVAAGTLLNAPAVGNPTKWIPINDNGTIRYIPAW